MRTVSTLLCTLLLSAFALADAPTGAIFTTVADGSEVNLNKYPSKEAVYLDGGPGNGAPQTAAGLDDGTYVFQVTEPAGKTLLSTDLAKCRQFTVANGIITGVVVTGCQHLTGLDVDHGATTVQLMPYNDTPNNGGVYKVWVTKVADFLAGCASLGVANGLNVVNCGFAAGNPHGFIPSNSKTDNCKVKTGPMSEIDVRFWDNATLKVIEGRTALWTDTLGTQNHKWDYWVPLYKETVAHIEAAEEGTHKISIADQTGCKVTEVWVASYTTGKKGPQDVFITVKKSNKDFGVYIDVWCDVQ